MSNMKMCSDMKICPLGQRILLTNPGGKIVQGTPSHSNIQDFIEWKLLPQRAKKNPNPEQNKFFTPELLIKSQAGQVNVNAASPVATTSDYFLRDDMQRAPHGEELLLINPSGTLVIGILSQSNRQDFIEWQQIPEHAPRMFADLLLHTAAAPEKVKPLQLAA